VLTASRCGGRGLGGGGAAAPRLPRGLPETGSGSLESPDSEAAGAATGELSGSLVARTRKEAGRPLGCAACQAGSGGARKDQRVGLGGAGTHLPRSPDGAAAQGAPAKDHVWGDEIWDMSHQNRFDSPGLG
ncbi:hypothetical protein MJG53_006121, partial [Ovis ammon polii x Ovis aries]